MRVGSSLLLLSFASACGAPSSSLEGAFGKVIRAEPPTGLDASVTCQPTLPTMVLDLPSRRNARVAFVGQTLAVAAVHDAGVEVQLLEPGRAAVVRSFPSPAVNLALGVSGGVLGLGWDSPTADRHIQFAVVDTLSGLASAPSRLSPELGRSQEPVQGEFPRVAARETGFFVVWEDSRTSEPRGTGNLFGWRGLYGRAVDLLGEPRGSDVQVVQTSGGSRTFDVAWTGSEWLTLWSSGDGPVSVSGRFSGQGYTPAREPAPLTVVAERNRWGVVRLVAGTDGRVLAAVPFASPAGSPRVGTLVVSRSGATPFIPWPDSEPDLKALAATPAGYVAVTLASLWQLDADGQRVRSQPVAIASAGAGSVGDVSVAVAGRQVRLAFTLETPAGASVWSAHECLP